MSFVQENSGEFISSLRYTTKIVRLLYVIETTVDLRILLIIFFQQLCLLELTFEHITAVCQVNCVCVEVTICLNLCYF